MRKVVEFTTKIIVPFIIVLVLEILIELPDYFNVIIYTILFLIMNEYISKRKNDKLSERR